jgi:hypothetical protein
MGGRGNCKTASVRAVRRSGAFPGMPSLAARAGQPPGLGAEPLSRTPEAGYPGTIPLRCTPEASQPRTTTLRHGTIGLRHGTTILRPISDGLRRSLTTLRRRLATLRPRRRGSAICQSHFHLRRKCLKTGRNCSGRRGICGVGHQCLPVGRFPGHPLPKRGRGAALTGNQGRLPPRRAGRWPGAITLVLTGCAVCNDSSPRRGKGCRASINHLRTWSIFFGLRWQSAAATALLAGIQFVSTHQAASRSACRRSPRFTSNNSSPRRGKGCRGTRLRPAISRPRPSRSAGRAAR